jgi:hypothetical protein
MNTFDSLTRSPLTRLASPHPQWSLQEEGRYGIKEVTRVNTSLENVEKYDDNYLL